MIAPLRVAIRADASQAIGTGHVRRCLALAEALVAAGARVLFVSRALGVAAVRAAGVDRVELPAPCAGEPVAAQGPPYAAWAGVDARRDARETVDAVRAWGGADRVVVDHYAFDAAWHREVGDMLRAPVAVVDDLGDRALYADLVVDQNLADHAAKYAGRLAAQARVLGGPRFTLLGAAYRDAPRRVRGGAVRSIGIFMGGVDAAGLSLAAMRACRDAGFGGALEVATSSAHPQLEALREACANDVASRLLVDAPDLAGFHARHDLEVGAGGGATWERCCLGVPSLLIAAAPNQQAVIPALAARGIAVAVAADEGRLREAIARELAALIADPARREAMSRAGLALVDGRGAQRVALVLAAQGLAVRAATAADSPAMLRWRNAPETRERSHDPRPIDPAEHERWLDATLADPARRLFVGQIGEIAIGVLRFDAAPGGDLRVSLYLDPQLHGLGLGTRLLAAGERVVAQTVGNGRFVATILDGNAASRRLFAGLGYRRQGDLWSKPVAAAGCGAPPTEVVR